MFPAVNRRYVEAPVDWFGKSWANSWLAMELGAFEGREVVEFVVTDPRSGRNGTATISSTTQKAIGYHG
jgi:hypothetical protein